MDNKLEGRICPNCGNLYVQKKLTPVGLSTVVADMVCTNGHNWREYYTCTYIGYRHLDKTYDSYGNEIKKDEVFKL